MAGQSTPKTVQEADDRQQFASSNEHAASVAGQQATEPEQKAEGKHHPAHMTSEEQMADQTVAQPVRPEENGQQSVSHMAFKPFEPGTNRKFGLDDTFVQITASVDPRGRCFDEQALHDTAEDFDKRELRHIVAMVSEYMTKDCQHHVKFNRRQRLILVQGNDQLRQKLLGLPKKPMHVAIIAWQGLSFPRPFYELEFEELTNSKIPTQPRHTPEVNPKKFWLSDHHESGLRWRCSAFAIFESERSECISGWVDRVKKLFAPNEQQHLVTGHVGVNFEADELTLKQLVQKTPQGPPTSPEEFHEKQKATAAMHALLELHYHGKSSLAVHGNKFFDAGVSDLKAVNGLLRCAGITRVLRPGMLCDVEMSEEPTFKLFFPSAPTTVADFLTQNYTSLLGNEQRELYNAESCGKVLRNIRVYVPYAADSKATEIRSINSISRSTCNTLPAAERGHGWPSKQEARNDRLPLLNIGSERRLRLLPAELCYFLPMQTFNPKKRPLTSDTKAALAKLDSEASATEADNGLEDTDKILQLLSDRKEQIFRPPGTSADTTNRPAAMDEPEAEPSAKVQERTDEGSEDAAKSLSGSQRDGPVLSKPPYYLFVVPTADGTDDGTWQQLCSSVMKHGGKVPGSRTDSKLTSPTDSSSGQVSSRNKSEIESRTLRLRYRSDCIGAAEVCWPKLLCAFVKQHAHQYDRIVVILCMPQNKCTKAIHKILKRACDLSAGVQSLSINSGMLQKLVNDYPRRGAHIVARNLHKRQFAVATAHLWSPASQSRTLPLRCMWSSAMLTWIWHLPIALRVDHYPCTSLPSRQGASPRTWHTRPLFDSSARTSGRAARHWRVCQDPLASSRVACSMMVSAT